MTMAEHRGVGDAVIAPTRACEEDSLMQAWRICADRLVQLSIRDPQRSICRDVVTLYERSGSAFSFMCVVEWSVATRLARDLRAPLDPF